ncbi:uncharacterized protein LOC110625806 [Manihot esculenta]|uniref:Uncharacterized protein n=6 Tax=Manihot esculenta TaxID=3983 RepID=A0ACB7GUG2_MANES|nr:uncharacterized protein LOC110625806 [Manihot esculenta]XP_043817954.1 uncharacterized protein LOC110625806 [Manihot esculenta]XP_043817955.1 uncharacterized protein LOC110625806 [Manihot esculenta]KAG8643854.1 hypothetical protein MANES_11G073800v8 [Manihot esculenta]KAG8643855.1 hypothetical protein MANES_11G073800v8 [Manihot esculenta]KAG8643856.1 hypothetical protein MANES_11G073800v8 [Manihot esculenta]KAG8643857.1 hypothetical protein MANES_11G073800v8 [Manihot esculenta]KAG8643858.
MPTLIYQIFSASALISLGVYHLTSTIRNFLKSPQSFSARPHHPLPSSSARLKHLHLYILLLCLLIAFAHQILISSDFDPLLKGHTPVHRFTSLQSAALLFLFVIVSVALLLSESTSLLPLPPDLFFALGSALFFLQYSVSSSAASVQTSDLQAKCDSVSAQISAVVAFLCLILAFQPRMFIADAGLAGAICLQGLWVLQTGLSLYVEVFIPEGCHWLLEMVRGVEGSTKCDLEESRLRAVAILNLLFVVHVTFVVLIVMVTYAVMARTIGIRRLGSYEALPTTASDSNHIQMKAFTGTQA